MAVGSILPDILEVARDHGLDLRRVAGRPGEHRANCPFCPGGDRGRHLYLNATKGTFNCFRCGARGGVLSFLARLEGRSERAVLEDLRGEKKVKTRRPEHPAEDLTADQLKAMGFIGPKPSWYALRQRDPGYARRVADWIWREWQEFARHERYRAAVLLLVAVRFGFYRRAAALVRERGDRLGLPLIDDVIRGLNRPDPPDWARAANKAYHHIADVLQALTREGLDPGMYVAFEEVRCPLDPETWAAGMAQLLETAQKDREKLAV
ncbi:CHC2 zinc finger domain-containing protein [Moorellaceae bacterium AZ2]